MSTEQQIEVGQVWQRNNDGRRIRVVGTRNVPWPSRNPYQDVFWRGVDKPGRGVLYEDSLRKRYTLVEGTGQPTNHTVTGPPSGGPEPLEGT